MNQDRVAGWAMIAGSLGCVLTMVMHPTCGSLEKIIREGRLATGVHALAIVSLCVQVFGVIRLPRAASGQRGWIELGVVAFTFAAICGALAAVLSGILGPTVAARTVAAQDQTALRTALLTSHLLNEALSRVFIAGSAAAIGILSVGLVRWPGGWRILASVGLLLAAASLWALLAGRISNNVHDVGMSVFAMAAWIVGLGAMMCRRRLCSAALE